MAGSESLLSLLGIYDNLNDPIPLSNKKSTILGLIIAFMVASWTCGLARLYVRFFVVYAPGIDDALLCIYLMTTTLGSVLTCVLTNWSLGQHFILQTYEVMMGYLKRFYIANASYVMSTSLIKMSLLSQYLRVYESGKMRWFCIGMTVFVGLWGFSYAFIAWVPCVPLTRFWDPLNVSGTCWGYGGETASDFIATFESHAAMNMILDIIVFSIPVPLYFKPGTNSRTRMGLLALLFMGSAVIFVSIWRLQTLIGHRAATSPTFDPTWYAPISLILSAIEVDIASICASLPVFWPILQSQVTKIFVTQEIRITHEDRVVDQFELHRTWSGVKGREVEIGSMDCPGTSSPEGSEVGLGLKSPAGGELEGRDLERPASKKSQAQHQGKHVRDRVQLFSGLGSAEEGKVEVHVRSESQTETQLRGQKISFFPKF